MCPMYYASVPLLVELKEIPPSVPQLDIVNQSGLKQLEASCDGCYIGHVFMGTLGYAKYVHIF